MGKDEPIKIEHGIESPKKCGNSRWPFLEMQIGDSFVVSSEDANHARNAATACKIRTRGEFNFATRQVKGGVRIWRIA